MINLAVISLKDIIRFFRNIIIILIIIVLVFKIIIGLKNLNYTSLEELKQNCFANSSYTSILQKTILISNSFKSEETVIKQESGIKKVLMSELVILGTEEELMELENQEELISNNFNNQQELKQDIVENTNQDVQTTPEVSSVLPTKVITEKNKTDKFTDIYKSVKIKNESKYQLTEDMVLPNVDFSNKKDIIIYHTHTCESYTATESYNYVQSGNFRSTDLNFSVARVGDELDKQLTSYGVQVIHDKTYHDYPAYNGSYGRSLKTAESILANHSDVDIVIDLHRDAIADETYAPKVKIGDEYASQLMFVMGSNVANSINSNWNQNLKFAIKVMQKANELYPGLFKPIILRNSEYNQHVSKAACIIEVGATGNTLEESMGAMKYLAKILESI